MKKLKNPKAKRVTLKHVVSRASKDKDFLSSLLKAPKATLKKNALELSEADGKKLNTFMAKSRKKKSNPPSEQGKLLGLEKRPWSEANVCDPDTHKSH